MKLTSTAVCALSIFTLTQAGFAAGPAVQHQFQSGQPAVASQVNDNFQELADRIADLPNAQTYDYHDYFGFNNGTVKTFRLADATECNIEERRIAVTDVDATTKNIVITRIRRNDATTCQHVEFDMTAKADAYTLNALRNYSTDGANLTNTSSIETPVRRLTAAMRIGQSWGDASPVQSSASPGTQTIIEKGTLLAVEDISVSGADYTACLKVHTSRASSNRFGSPALTHISWYCPNAGLVKRISVAGLGAPRVLELTSVAVP